MTSPVTNLRPLRTDFRAPMTTTGRWDPGSSLSRQLCPAREANGARVSGARSAPSAPKPASGSWSRSKRPDGGRGAVRPVAMPHACVRAAARDAGASAVGTLRRGVRVSLAPVALAHRAHPSAAPRRCWSSTPSLRERAHGPNAASVSGVDQLGMWTARGGDGPAYVGVDEINHGSL